MMPPAVRSPWHQPTMWDEPQGIPSPSHIPTDPFGADSSAHDFDASTRTTGEAMTSLAPGAASAHAAPSQMMNEHEAAQHLAVSIHALRQWRYKGGGPRYVKLGHSVRYRLADLEAYVQSNLRDNSAQS